jgi:hypothetical protein
VPPGTSSNEVFYEREKAQRFEMVRNDIATRLRKGCGHFSDADFALLVEQIARVQIRTESSSSCS